MRQFIEINLDIEGVHRWENCDIAEVLYLQHPHRHIFKMILRKEVIHGDRQIEFIKFKHEVKFYIGKTWYNLDIGCCDFGTMSCEQIAAHLLERYELSYCSVSEDGEFAGIVQRD